MATKIVSPPTGASGADAVKRRCGVASGAVAHTVLATCDVIDIQEYSQVAVKPTGVITTLAVYASATADGTFVLVDSIGTAGVVTVVTSKWNVLDPTKIGPFGFIKLLADAVGTVDVLGKT